MKKLIVLAAFALAAGTVGSQACDYERNAANATPVVVATTEQPTAQQPAATPAPSTPKVVTDEPANLAPTTVACTGNNC
jgi:hypothetical protein